MVIEFHLLVVVINAQLRSLQHSDSNSAEKSLTLLCLIDINSPFGHDRACSSLNAAPQNDGINVRGILYLIKKLSQNDSFSRQKPYFLIGNEVSQLHAPTSILAWRALVVILSFINVFISSSFSQFL